MGRTLTVAEDVGLEGGYITRGRYGALLRMLDELTERVAQLEGRVDEEIAFEHELLRRRIATDVDLLRSAQRDAQIRRGRQGG